MYSLRDQNSIAFNQICYCYNCDNAQTLTCISGMFLSFNLLSNNSIVNRNKMLSDKISFSCAVFIFQVGSAPHMRGNFFISKIKSY